MAPQRRSTDRPSTDGDAAPDSLATLIRREQDMTGASYADIAKASGLSKAKIGQIAQPGSQYQIRPDTIDKLARGLRLPVSIVKRAALVTAGIEDKSSPKAGRIELIVHQLEMLDGDTLALIEAMVAAAVRQRRGDG